MAAAEARDAGAALGELHARYAALGGYDARSRAGRLMHGLGFSVADEDATGCGVFRRLAHAAQSRAGADVPLGPAAARRADQSPRPRCGPVAGRVAAQLSRHAADDRARSRVPRSQREPHRAHRAGRGEAVHRQLLCLRRTACRAARATAIAVRAPAARDPSHDELRRALPRESEQGAPGAKPPQGAGTHGADRPGSRRFAVRVLVPRAAEAAASAADAGAAVSRVRRASRAAVVEHDDRAR